MILNTLVPMPHFQALALTLPPNGYLVPRDLPANRLLKTLNELVKSGLVENTTRDGQACYLASIFGVIAYNELAPALVVTPSAGG